MTRSNLTIRWMAAVSAVSVLAGCSPGEPPAGELEVREPVSVIALGRRDLQRRVTLPGVVEAAEERVLSAARPGRIEWIRVEEGDQVEAGAEIAGIDEAILSASVALARARLDLAEKDLDRVTTLHEEGATSPEELDRAQAERDVAAAQFQAAEAEARHGVVVAPVPGVIDELPMEVGEYANPGDPIARLVDARRLEVIVHVPEREIAGVSEATPVSLQSTVGEASATGRIVHIAAAADARTRTFRTRIEVDPATIQGTAALRPGAIGRAELATETLRDTVAVPLSVIVTRDGIPGVMVVRDGKALWHTVRLGLQSGAWIQVVEGVDAGARLIVAGQNNIREGDPVEVVDEIPWARFVDEVAAMESLSG